MDIQPTPVEESNFDYIFTDTAFRTSLDLETNLLA
jgi:hypothetical protein